MKIEFHTADVFTDRLFGGNPLAVVSDARALDEARMQRIAREFNLSETVFVLPPAQAPNTRRLRIFTPACERPFAGHPTVGAAFVLASIGAVTLDAPRTDIVFEEGVGPVPVSILADDDGRPVSAALSAARMPEQGPPPPPAAALAEVLSLAPGDLLERKPGISAWSCGVPFLFVAVRDRAALARARVAGEAWRRHVAEYWASEIFVLCVSPHGDGEPQVSARMFAPGLGVAEDPATGSAAAALAGYLCQDATGFSGTRRWVVEQGVDMGRPSRLEVEADLEDGAIGAVRVGGACVMVSEGKMEIG